MENKMKMRPMGDQLLLKAKEDQTTTKSGIILTGTDAAYGDAEVISVGPGWFTATGDKIPMTCRVGDVVLLHSRLSISFLGPAGREPATNGL